jgi:hypothetical protein
LSLFDSGGFIGWQAIIKTDFAIVLTVANAEIVRFQMLEDNFAVSQAARS